LYTKKTNTTPNPIKESKCFTFAHAIKNIKNIIGHIIITEPKSGCNHKIITTANNNPKNGINPSTNEETFSLYFLK